MFMTYLTPQIIAEVTGGEFIGRSSEREVRVVGAVKDNREVKRGNLFVCIRGARADGHSFANSAFESGAACCLAETRINDAHGPYVLVPSTLEAVKKLGGYYRALFDMPVIGITGSVGKTTTKELTAAVLGTKYNVLKTPANMNNELGVPLTLLSLTEQHEAAVIEMGISDFGEMSRLAAMVRPDICIITEIGYSHLEALGDRNGVLQAKGEVFEFMDTTGFAVLNRDNDLLRAYDPGINKVTFGLDAGNDFRAENVRLVGTDKVEFEIVSKNSRFTACVPSYGVHLAKLAAAAAAVGSLLGLTDENIIEGLFSYKPVDGRSNVIKTGFITLIDDCYNANPNSVRAALSSLSSLPNRRVAILGDMLDLSALSDQLHREVGSFAAQNGIDCLICCGKNAAFIYEGYLSGGGENAYYYQNKDELSAVLPVLIKENDAALVKASHSMKFEELLPVLLTAGGDKV